MKPQQSQRRNQDCKRTYTGDPPEGCGCSCELAGIVIPFNDSLTHGLWGFILALSDPSL